MTPRPASVFVSKYSGSDFVSRNSPDVAMSEFGVLVADILGELFKGIYHMDSRALKKAEWNCKNRIEICLPGAELSTYDFDLLTQMVFICHDWHVRLTIRAHTFSALRLIFTRRLPSGDYTERHPSLDEAVASWREKHPLP